MAAGARHGVGQRSAADEIDGDDQRDQPAATAAALLLVPPPRPSFFRGQLSDQETEALFPPVQVMPPPAGAQSIA